MKIRKRVERLVVGKIDDANHQTLAKPAEFPWQKLERPPRNGVDILEARRPERSGIRHDLAPVRPAKPRRRTASNLEINALARAERADIPAFTVRLADYPARQDWDAALARACTAYAPDLIVLAGFMKLVGPAFLESLPAEYTSHRARQNASRLTRPSLPRRGPLQSAFPSQA